MPGPAETPAATFPTEGRSGACSSRAHTLSVVVPARDEADSLGPLCRRLAAVLRSLGCDWEAVVVDDASADGTPALLQRLARDGLPLKIVRLPAPSGQTAALQAGFDRASGDVLVTMDGDGQNDPSDLPGMLARLKEGYDLVCGYRIRRADPIVSRQFPSRVANALLRWGTWVPLHDVGCGLRVFRRRLLTFRWEDPMHRYFPLVAAWQGARVCELEVTHHPRVHGTAKYGWGRAVRFLGDMRKVRRQVSRAEIAPAAAVSRPLERAVPL